MGCKDSRIGCRTLQQKDVKPDAPTQEEIQAHRELREAVLEHSRRSMLPVIARYL